MSEQDWKQELIQGFQHHEGDTGSTEVQVAILTTRIGQITNHLQSQRKDFHTQRGLLKLVGRRRRLLRYLRRENVSRYQALISSLGLRR